MSQIDNFNCSSISKAATLLQASETAYIETHKIKDPEVKMIAGLTTKGTLDHGDLFVLLSETQDSELSCSGAIREALHLPKVDPENVDLIFKSIPLGNGSNAAMVIIRPKGYDQNKATDVHVGGIYHPAGLYLKGATDFAISEGREMILIDSVGVGGSQSPLNQSIDYNLLATKMSEAIRKSTDGKIRYLMGHSLGSIVVRHMFFEDKASGEKKAEKYIPITMVPSILEERAGLKMSGLFSQLQALHVVFTGEMEAVLNDKFFQTHEKRDWIESVVGKQVFPISVFDFAGILSNVSSRPLLDYIGVDPSLVVVFASKDRIMELFNKDEWERKGVLFLSSEKAEADHSCMAGEEQSIDFWQSLRKGLAERPDEKLPQIDKSSIMRRVTPGLGIPMMFDFKAPFDPASFSAYGFIGLEGNLTFGLHRFVDIVLRAQVLVGGFNNFYLPAVGKAEFQFTPGETTHWTVSAGAKGNYDVLNSSYKLPTPYLSACYNIFNVSRIRIEIAPDDVLKPGGIQGLFSLEIPLSK